MIGAAELAQMKPGALFVNVARGLIADEAALTEALRAGQLNAALDAYSIEPVPQDSLLRTLPNVTPTPHSAGASRQSRERIWTQMKLNLDLLAAGKEPQNIVNLRDLRPPR
jgi:phosphoglycerate dehydrogenase-like enzyme